MRTLLGPLIGALILAFSLTAAPATATGQVSPADTVTISEPFGGPATMWLLTFTNAWFSGDCKKAISTLQLNSGGPGAAWAYTYLGDFAERGDCMPRDPAKAAEFYRNAIRYYSDDALILLGRLHLTGSGVEQDTVLAERLFRRGVLRLIDIVPANRQPTQLIWLRGNVPTALHKSMEWLESLPDDRDSLLAMARALRDGDEFQRDLRSAFLWYRQAAEKGSVEALHEMAIMMIDESGAPKDLYRGAGYLLDAARKGNGPSQFELGKRLARGDDGKPRYRSAYFWLLRAADNGMETRAERVSVAAKLNFVARYITQKQARDIAKYTGTGLTYP